jgi:putative glutamine amidotransferase
MTGRVPPLIGITADVSYTSFKPSCATADPTLFLPKRYLAAIQAAGAVPIVLPANPAKSAMHRVLSLLNGLVLSGGNFDIHPRHYGERPIKQLGAIKSARTDFELEITDQALKMDLPILGICGGAQAINVALGGSLYQDIATQLQDTGAGEHRSQNPDGGHSVHIEAGTRLFDIVKHSSLKVNTSHHQAVKRLGRGLIVNAVAGDHVIEGIESAEHGFVLGVQWHPEVLAPHQQHQQRIFSSFAAFCRNRLRVR